MIANQLYHQGKDRKLCICVIEGEHLDIIEHAYLDIPRGHFFANVTVRTIVRGGLWWQTFFQDAKSYVKKCGAC